MKRETQLDLETWARARAADPMESHAAGVSLRPNTVARCRWAILATLTHMGPLPDYRLVELLSEDFSPSGIRTRRRELNRAGLVERRGTALTPAGRATALWGAT